MAFWSNMDVEPKRQHRWYVTFDSNNNILNQIRYAVKKVSKPSAKIGSVQHKYLNHFFNFPGRLEWQDVTISFASISQPDATQLLDIITSRAGYKVPTTPNELETIGKTKFNASIGTVTITQVNPNGDNIEEWKLFKPFFTDIKYGDLDYSNEEIVEIQCTIKYDWASLNGNRSGGAPTP